MNIPDHISESLETIFWVKILKNSFLRMRIRESFGPGSGMEKIRIQDKHPGSATLPSMTPFFTFPVPEF